MEIPDLSARYQWFVAQNLETGDQIFYTIDNPSSYYRCRIPELLGRRIRACFHGWLILSNHPNIVMWSLWNPLTYKLITLPPLVHKESDSHESCLSSPPDDQNSIFLLTTRKKPIIVFCRVNCTRKRFRWTQMSYAKQLKKITGHGEDGVLESPACFNGKVYALYFGYDNFVIEIDIVVKGKDVAINLFPFVQSPRLSLNRCPAYNRCSTYYPFLKGSLTELFYIAVFKDETTKIVVYVDIFKLNITSTTWEKLKDLKDAILFIELASDHSVFYRPAVASELGGYVHILCDMGKIIYSYNVKDKTIALSSMPCPVRESKVSAWAMLECRLEVDHIDSEQEHVVRDDEIVIRPVKGDGIESHLLDIPFPILEMIMEFSFGVEYMNFRATCKHCHLAAPPIQWSSKTMLKRLHTYSLVSPWLMVLDNDRGIITFIDPIFGDKYFIKTPQELSGDYQIYCAGYGWLLMYKLQDGPLVFFNPFTSDIIKLPLVPFLGSLCFSAPPTSPNCMVVGFTRVGEEHVYIHFLGREPLWRRFRLDFGGDDPYCFHFPTFYGRDIYALRKEGGLDIFRETGEDDFSLDHVLAKPPKTCCKSPPRYMLAYCDQILLLVIVGEFGESVEVFKLNDVEGAWEKIDVLGKHVIFICDTTCVCIEAKTREMENKVFFPRLSHPESGKIVCYSLETCLYHTFNGKNVQEFSGKLFRTKHFCQPHAWIEPSWS